MVESMSEQAQNEPPQYEPTAPKVVIIGAGISGLAAAWTLQQRAPSLDVQVLEASSRAGGVLETILDPPYLIERSADNFAVLMPDALDLCKATGYVEHLISPEQHGRQAFVLSRGRVLPIPSGFSLVQPTRIWPILSTPTLSWAGRLRVLSEYFVAPRSAQEDESLESFTVRRLGREAFERLVEPIVSGIFTADPTQLSMQATLPQFVKMEKEHGGLIRGHRAARRQKDAAVARRASGARYDQFMAPRYGMSHWVEHLVQSLQPGTVQFNTPVHSIERISHRAHPSDHGAKWRLRTPGSTLQCDALIVAAPAHQTSHLLRAPEPAIADQLETIPYASSCIVVLAVDRSELRERVDGFGLIVPSVEKRPVLAISYSSNKYSGRAPGDQLLLRLFFGGAMHATVLDQSDAELIAVAQQQLREILKWTGKGCRWQGVVRWPQAMPQYHLGHIARVDQLKELVRSAGALRLCGAAYQGVGIPQTVRSGRQAAEEILETLAPMKNAPVRPA